MNVNTLGEHALPAVNYLRVTDCETDAANRDESNRKCYRIIKRKIMKAYIPIYQSLDINLEKWQIRLYILFYKRSNQAVYLRRENKSQEFTKVSSWVQSITSNSLTAFTMQ